jgi:hypothetical protein
MVKNYLTAALKNLFADKDLTPLVFIGNGLIALCIAAAGIALRVSRESVNGKYLVWRY